MRVWNKVVMLGLIRGAKAEWQWTLLRLELIGMRAIMKTLQEDGERAKVVTRQAVAELEAMEAQKNLVRRDLEARTKERDLLQAQLADTDERMAELETKVTGYENDAEPRLAAAFAEGDQLRRRVLELEELLGVSEDDLSKTRDRLEVVHDRLHVVAAEAERLRAVVTRVRDNSAPVRFNFQLEEGGQADWGMQCQGCGQGGDTEAGIEHDEECDFVAARDALEPAT